MNPIDIMLEKNITFNLIDKHKAEIIMQNEYAYYMLMKLSSVFEKKRTILAAIDIMKSTAKTIRAAFQENPLKYCFPQPVHFLVVGSIAFPQREQYFTATLETGCDV